MPDVLVIQSHREPLPAPWYRTCINSVVDWCEQRGYGYQWRDDALFDLLPADLRRKTLSQPVIAADLGRLFAMREALTQGFETVVWVDADVLVFDPDALQVVDADYAFGREDWVQQTQQGDLRVYSKVHNAFMMFRQHNPVLEFYLHAAQRLVRRHEGPMAPQLVGPKFLSVLHNLLGFPVVENAAVLSPAVVHDLLDGGGPALERFRNVASVPPAAVNLCGSMISTGLLTDLDVAQVIDLLIAQPSRLKPTDKRTTA